MSVKEVSVHCRITTAIIKHAERFMTLSHDRKQYAITHFPPWIGPPKCLFLCRFAQVLCRFLFVLLRLSCHLLSQFTLFQSYFVLHLVVHSTLLSVAWFCRCNRQSTTKTDNRCDKVPYKNNNVSH